MSTTINQYLLYGIRFEYDDFNTRLKAMHGDNAEAIEDQYHENGYAKNVTGHDGFAFIVDGMNGEYAFFGVVVQKPSRDDYLDTVSIQPFSRKERKRLRLAAEALLGADLPSDGWHVISHWH